MSSLPFLWVAIRLIQDLLDKRYDIKEGTAYCIDGVPQSVDAARELSARDPHQFQNWAIELAGGFCSSKKSADKGVDGRIWFELGLKYQNMVISIKGGQIANPANIRELRGTLETRG